MFWVLEMADKHGGSASCPRGVYRKKGNRLACVLLISVQWFMEVLPQNFWSPLQRRLEQKGRSRT